jgi:hypothetical protein
MLMALVGPFSKIWSLHGRLMKLAYSGISGIVAEEKVELAGLAVTNQSFGAFLISLKHS